MHACMLEGYLSGIGYSSLNSGFNGAVNAHYLSQSNPTCVHVPDVPCATPPHRWGVAAEVGIGNLFNRFIAFSSRDAQLLRQLAAKVS